VYGLASPEPSRALNCPCVRLLKTTMSDATALLKVRVTEALGDSAACAAALRLADANRTTLGFFPADAFREKADSRQLLVAERTDGNVLGYLLYRTARDRASITHLCVAGNARRAGVAKQLIGALRARVARLRFIEARCRKDYEAHEAWMRLGFAAEAEVAGRGRERKPITVFRYDLGHDDLFTLPVQSSKVLRCAIDTNVLIGMQEGHAECNALVADWLSEDVEFVVTPEVRNDLMRSSVSERNKRRLRYAANFAEVRSPPERFENAQAVARSILPPSSRTDARHLARASSAQVDIFLTRDEEVLQRAPRILDELDLQVLHPDELVRQLESLQKAEDYAPVKLAGTSIDLSPLIPGDLPAVERALRYGGHGERSREFRHIVREGFRGGTDWDVLWVRDRTDSSPLGLLIGQKVDGDRYDVHALRVPPGKASETTLMRALARHLAYFAIELGVRRRCMLTLIKDHYLHPALRLGLEDEGFRRCGAALGHIQLNRVGELGDVTKELKRLMASGLHGVGACLSDLHSVINELQSGVSATGSLGEARFWPLKLLGVGIRNYIVPIQPQWAEHLFDAGLADQGLFGADLRLGLARESVYYRSSAGTRIRAPARLLWYVSASSKYDGTKAVRGCSALTGVECDSARNLYRRYQRLGVWKWNHVLEKASGDPEGRLMALQFGQSECFAKPVPYSRVLQALGRRLTFQGPVEISEEAFREVYLLGSGEL